MPVCLKGFEQNRGFNQKTTREHNFFFSFFLSSTPDRIWTDTALVVYRSADCVMRVYVYTNVSTPLRNECSERVISSFPAVTGIT